MSSGKRETPDREKNFKVLYSSSSGADYLSDSNLEELCQRLGAIDINAGWAMRCHPHIEEPSSSNVHAQMNQQSPSFVDSLSCSPLTTECEDSQEVSSLITEVSISGSSDIEKRVPVLFNVIQKSNTGKEITTIEQAREYWRSKLDAEEILKERS
ncbi:hypothetical protein N9W34_02125 [Rickettsiales bacterium]|nr:hypothetical protein [Rickettsiales bacterium]